MGWGDDIVNGHDFVVDGGNICVTRGWTTVATARGEMTKRIKAAAAAL